MNKEAEERLCRALAVWAEREISEMYDEVYEDDYAYFTVRRSDGTLEHRKHATLTGEGIKDSSADRWTEYYNSPEEAARVLVEHTGPGDLKEIFGAKKSILIWRDPVEIKGSGDYRRRFAIMCRCSIVFLQDGEGFFAGDGKTELPNFRPLREWTAPSF